MSFALSPCHSEQRKEPPGMDDVSPSSRLHTSRAGNENTCQSTVVKNVRQRSMQMPGLRESKPGIWLTIGWGDASWNRKRRIRMWSRLRS